MLIDCNRAEENSDVGNIQIGTTPLEMYWKKHLGLPVQGCTLERYLRCKYPLEISLNAPETFRIDRVDVPNVLIRSRNDHTSCLPVDTIPLICIAKALERISIIGIH